MRDDLEVIARATAEGAPRNLSGAYNPPGLRSLVYRSGTYSSFLREMLARVHTEEIPDGPNKGKRPLRKLNVEDGRGFVVALMRSWAMIGDILTFYQERIANEGFLRTATERRSVLELVRSIGYELNPGIAASTYLAFTAADTPGVTDRAIVPRGTPIQSVPSHGEMPQIFETEEDLETRPEWNLLTPMIPTYVASATILSDTTELRLKGVMLPLAVGDSILILGRSSGARGESSRYIFRTLTRVEPEPKKGYTLVAWEQVDNGEPLTNLKVYAFLERAFLFGNVAQKWPDLPDAIKLKWSTQLGGVFYSGSRGDGWRQGNAGLPNKSVRQLVITEKGEIFAGTAGAGVYRSTDGARSWTAVNEGLSQLDIYALALNCKGHLLAGSLGGWAFRSTDRGESWEMISGMPSLKRSFFGLRPTNSRLPNTIIRAFLCRSYKQSFLFSVVTKHSSYLFAGTDNGIYRGEESSDEWTPVNHGLLNLNDDTGGSKTAVFAIAPGLKRKHLFIGTDSGVYSTTNNGDTWKPVNTGLPGADPLSCFSTSSVRHLVSYIDINDAKKLWLFAGAADGVYRSSNRGRLWEKASNGLPEGPVNALAAYTDKSNGKNYVFAATDKGVFRSEDHGEHWVLAGPEAGLADVSAISVNTRAEVVAATPFAGFVDKEIPAFHLQPGMVDLSNVHRRVVPGSWVVLRQQMPEGPPRIGVYEAKRVTVVARHDYGLDALSTRIEVDAGDELLEFDLRTTEVFIQSDQLPVYEPIAKLLVPVEKRQIELSTIVPGLEAGRRVAVTGKAVRASIAAVGGVYKVSEMKSMPLGLSTLDVRALAATTSGEIFAGTRGEGVFHSADGGVTWHPSTLLFTVSASLTPKLDEGVLPPDLRDAFEANKLPLPDGAHIAVDRKGSRWQIHSKEDATLYRMAREDAEIRVFLVIPDIHALLCDRVTNDLYLGAKDGQIFCSTNAGVSWSSIVEGLPALDVRCLTASPLGVLLGSDHGLFRLGADGAWERIGSDLAGLEISSVALLDETGDRLIVGTMGSGVYVSDDGGKEWSDSNSGLENLYVTSVAVDPAGYIFAGTRGGGLFRSTGPGRRWVQADRGLSSKFIQCLAVDAAGAVHAGTIGAGIFRTTNSGASWERIDLGISSDIRTLVPMGDAIIAGARNVAILVSEDGLEYRELRPEFLFTMSVDFALELDQGSLTRELRQEFHRNGIHITEDAALLVSKRSSSWLLVDGPDQKCSIRRQLDTLSVYRAIDSLRVVQAPRSIMGGELLRWRLVDKLGFVGMISARPEEIVLEPSHADDEQVCDVGMIGSAENDNDITTITLRQPLRNIYDRETVAVYANVAYATHGRTIEMEVLGSGVASISNQQFQIKVNPLTHVPAPTADGTASTLSIRIKEQNSPNGILWREAPNLYMLGPYDRGYMVRVDEHGNSTVIFGDGKKGARLPTGIENIVATYRSGIGPDGEVDSGSLMLLPRRPVGILSVTNPLAATGAADPESIDSARVRAPLTVRTLDRIVSVRDFEDFVRTFSGISKATAKALWADGEVVLHITAAAEDGDVIDKSSGLYRDLIEALHTYSAPTPFPVRVDSYEPVFFNVEVQIWIKPGWFVDDVADNVRRALLDAFPFEKRTFGENVSEADVTMVVQGAPGVLAVNVTALYRHDYTRELNLTLYARKARWDQTSETVLPAQIVMINAKGETGIQITVVSS